MLCLHGESIGVNGGIIGLLHITPNFILLLQIMACSNVSRRRRLVAKPAGENHLSILRLLLREQRYLEYCASSKENPYRSRCLW